MCLTTRMMVTYVWKTLATSLLIPVILLRSHRIYMVQTLSCHHEIPNYHICLFISLST